MSLHASTNISLELVLICFAAFFNRGMVTISILLSCLVGAYRYEAFLFNLGYRPVQHELSIVERLRYGVVFMLYYAVALGIMVSSTQIMKYTIKRPRPEIPAAATRMVNLVKHEAGTWAMPSGDSAAAACFCFMYTAFLRLPSVYIILPLVCCGRVFFHCHYFGDTFIGSIVGTLWGLFVFQIFTFTVPAAQWIAGPNTFLPLTY